jgi:Xaa-Pro aminopeptidase
MELVPKEEIKERIKKFQAALALENLDGAFILQNVDIYYFSGTLQSSILYIPREGSPLLMASKSYERAKSESSLDCIIPVSGKAEIKNVLSDFKTSLPAQAGLEMDVLPASIYLWYQQTFPQCRWVDVSGIIRRLRMIKSPYEVEQIKRATRILDKGYHEIKAYIREGMSELEIDGYLSFIARREGHMGILRMRGWNQEMTYAHVLSGDSGAVVSFLDSPHGGTGSTPAMAQGAGFRRVKRNEPIGIDYGVGINGYLADQFRTFVIGDLAPELAKAHECSREIHHLLAKEAKPGVSCADLYRLAVDKAREAGLADFFMGHGEGQVRFIGHGLGLEIDEYPILSPLFQQPLAEGMVMAIEPKFIFPGKGVVGLEDDYLVTASGIERVTLNDQVVFSL